WRVAAIRPVEDSAFEIELEIDRLRKTVEPFFDVRASAADFAFRHVNAGPENAPQGGVVRALLRPVDLFAHGIDRNPDAPLGGILAVLVAFARLHQRLDVRAV